MNDEMMIFLIVWALGILFFSLPLFGTIKDKLTIDCLCGQMF